MVFAIVFMAKSFEHSDSKTKMNYVETERATEDGVFYTPKPISFPSAEVVPSQKPLKATEFAQIETKTREADRLKEKGKPQRRKRANI